MTQLCRHFAINAIKEYVGHFPAAAVAIVETHYVDEDFDSVDWVVFLDHSFENQILKMLKKEHLVLVEFWQKLSTKIMKEFLKTEGNDWKISSQVRDIEYGLIVGIEIRIWHGMQIFSRKMLIRTVHETIFVIQIEHFLV